MAETTVTVMKSDGRIVVVEKADAEEVRGKADAPVAAPAREPASARDERPDLPLGANYFLFDPLGFLQLGPVIEYGFLVGEDLYIAPRLRFVGLGLLTQVLGDFEVMPYSFSLGISGTRMIPAAGANKVYAGGVMEFVLGWSKGEDYWDEWEGNWGMLIFGSNVGYQWRNENRFGVRLGGLLGLGIQLWDRWWYVDDPDDVYDEDTGIYFYFGLQLALSWEQN
ncbi:MAG: hypothetical protein EA403_17150 [Spirochaetaceae bacterium]|nr:MAG: hypothetical protein EA403_17150 [Spirochaetaceae bacterium]